MIERWLRSFGSPRTRRSYRAVIKGFFRVLEVDDIDARVEEYRADPTVAMRDIDRYYAEWAIHKAPKTITRYLSTVRTFLRDQYIETPGYFWSKFRRRRRGASRAVLVEQIPTSEDLRVIFEHLPIEARALFGIMATAGTRIGETTNIEFADLELGMSPPRVYLRAETTKNRQARTVFITTEARDTLVEWLRVREDWFVRSGRRGFSRTRDMSDRVFPFGRETSRSKWRNGLVRAERFVRDAATGWATMRPHTLRKRFRTQLAAVIPLDIVECLLGHAGYETDAYRRYTEAELGEWYLKGSRVLYLSVDRAALEQMQLQVLKMGQKASEIEGMRREQDVMGDEIAELRRMLKRALDERG